MFYLFFLFFFFTVRASLEIEVLTKQLAETNTKLKSTEKQLSRVRQSARTAPHTETRPLTATVEEEKMRIEML